MEAKTIADPIPQTLETPVPMPLPMPHENSTDATRGEPLVLRAQKRRDELVQLLAELPLDAVRARTDVDTALTSIGDLLTGDTAHLSDATAANLNHWLETNKHLAERAPKAGS